MTLEEAEKCKEVISFVKRNVIRNLCMQMLIGIFLLIKVCNFDFILVNNYVCSHLNIPEILPMWC